ncbi:hypothetical protein YC2023_097549 [Brassica napus]
MNQSIFGYCEYLKVSGSVKLSSIENHWHEYLIIPPSQGVPEIRFQNKGKCKQLYTFVGRKKKKQLEIKADSMNQYFGDMYEHLLQKNFKQNGKRAFTNGLDQKPKVAQILQS